MIIELGKTLVSSELLEEKFVCDLTRCKGACCVEGDAGAPLDEDELGVLDDEWENIRPYIRNEGVAAIEAQGRYTTDSVGEWVTPLIDGKECAYTLFDADGTAKCGIEAAHAAGATDFKKPISCHLYPVRVTRYSTFDAVNYHEWNICSPACELGKNLQVPIFRFLKEPLIRKFGKDWYSGLEAAEAGLIK